MSSKNGIKQLLSMEKNHSPHKVIFTLDSDAHFVNVILLKRATGQVVATHYILRSDMPSWVTMYEGDGFEILTNNSENGE